jgi:hypothetical protein
MVFSTLKHQIRNLRSILLIMYIPTALFLLILAAARIKYDIAIKYFMEDANAMIGAPYYVGIASNIGILFWCSTAAICFFSYFLTKGDIRNAELRFFVLGSAVITSIMMLDDFFQLHEDVFPNHLHVDENVFFAIYGLLVCLYFIRFRKTIFDSEFIILFFALSFFALSMPFELFLHDLRGEVFFEEGLKLFGIISWFTYFLRVSMKLIRPGVNSSA